MGLHTGEPLAVPPKYVGMDVHKAARIMAAAHGGQVLLSQATQQLVPGSEVMSDLGEHRLKDLTSSVRLYQLGLDLFPPLETLERHPTNLPVQPSALVGRAGEVAEVISLVRAQRVVTLVGPGGTGKTRLALQAAAELLEDFRDGVFFVDLAPLVEPAAVISATLQTLGLRESGEESSEHILARFLRERRMLLVFDNFEHLLGAAASVATLVRGAATLHLLATSRAPLRIAGECEFPVPPLVQDEAVILFSERASAVDPGFRPDGGVADICRRLDGLPLAIELAAARVNLLSPAELLARLDERLAVLTTGARDAPARQQTLRATIEWSYDLLSASNRTHFARLGVFVGGCTLHAAEAICAGASDGGANILESFGMLVDNNLLRRFPSGEGRTRFAMLETVQEYAREQLKRSGELDRQRDMHAQYFVELAERAEPQLKGPNQLEWLDRLDEDYDNLRAALSWLAESRQFELEQRLAAAMGWFWYLRTYPRDGREALEHALRADPNGSVSLRAKLADALCQSLLQLGLMAELERVAAEHLALARESGDQRLLGRALTNVAVASGVRGGLVRARALGEESVAVLRAEDSPWELCLALLNLGITLLIENRPEDAPRRREILEDGLVIARAVGERQNLSRALGNLADVCFKEKRYTEARRLEMEAASVASELEDQELLMAALHGLARIAVAEEHEDVAARLLGAAQAVCDNRALGLQPKMAEERRQMMVAARRRLGQAFDVLFEEGRKLDPLDALEAAECGAAELSTARRGNG
jgi:predicted ATPase